MHNIPIPQNQKNIHQSDIKIPTLAQKSAKIVTFCENPFCISVSPSVFTSVRIRKPSRGNPSI
jgi:hypothetical protein